MLQLLSIYESAVQVPNAAGPNEVNLAGQTVLGLGLSVLMLTGFVFVLAVLFLTPLLIGWYRHRGEA